MDEIIQTLVKPRQTELTNVADMIAEAVASRLAI